MQGGGGGQQATLKALTNLRKQESSMAKSVAGVWERDHAPEAPYTSFAAIPGAIDKHLQQHGILLMLWLCHAHRALWWPFGDPGHWMLCHKQAKMEHVVGGCKRNQIPVAGSPYSTTGQCLQSSAESAEPLPTAANPAPAAASGNMAKNHWRSMVGHRVGTHGEPHTHLLLEQFACAGGIRFSCRTTTAPPSRWCLLALFLGGLRCRHSRWLLPLLLLPSQPQHSAVRHQGLGSFVHRLQLQLQVVQVALQFVQLVG